MKGVKLLLILMAFLFSISFVSAVTYVYDHDADTASVYTKPVQNESFVYYEVDNNDEYTQLLELQRIAPRMPVYYQEQNSQDIEDIRKEFELELEEQRVMEKNRVFRAFRDNDNCDRNENNSAYRRYYRGDYIYNDCIYFYDEPDKVLYGPYYYEPDYGNYIYAGYGQRYYFYDDNFYNGSNGNYNGHYDYYNGFYPNNSLPDYYYNPYFIDYPYGYSYPNTQYGYYDSQGRIDYDYYRRSLNPDFDGNYYYYDNALNYPDRNLGGYPFYYGYDSSDFFLQNNVGTQYDPAAYQQWKDYCDERAYRGFVDEFCLKRERFL